MNGPRIYDLDLYVFGKIIITNVWKMPGSSERMITVGARTPEYDKVFGNAWFHMEIPGLVKLMRKINIPDASDYRERFWQLFYETSENDRDEWDLGSGNLSKKIGSCPVIEACTIMANVDYFDRNEDKSIDSIEFRLGDPDIYILEKESLNTITPPGRNLRDISGDIRVLAMRQGRDLEEIWGSLNDLRSINNTGRRSEEAAVKEYAVQILESLSRWGHPDALSLANELQNFIFIYNR